MNKKRLWSLLLCAALVAGAISGCGKSPAPESGTPTANSTPASESQTTGEGTIPTAATGAVKMIVNVSGGKDDAEMTLFAAALSEATGLTVDIEKPASDYGQVVAQKLSAGEAYDLIQFNAPDYLNYINQGALLDITDRVKGSATLWNNVPEQEWTDITIDGKIYAGFNKRELHRVVALNKQHLEAINVDYKTIEPTLDGYYDLFKALKANNTNPDYYPLNTILSETWDLQPWFSAVGLKNGVVVDTDGKRYSPYATAEAAPVWEWFKKLYAEELLDPASFVDKTKDMREKMGAASQKNSVTADWAMWVGLHNFNAEAGGIAADAYEIVSLPGLKNPDGSYLLGKGSASLFSIPVNAPNPDGAMAILEYFATQEGGDLLSIGIEGHDYNIVDGKVELTETGMQHGKDHGAPVPIFKDWEAKAGLNRGVEEGLTYLEYSSVDLIIPNEKEWKETTGKWAIQMIRGDLSIEDGLQKMNAELIALDVTEK